MIKPTAATTPAEYITQIEEPRRTEIQSLHELIQAAAPSCKPFIIFNMLGYGPYHYRYASGREGDGAIIALASQKNYISLYLCAINDKGQYIAEQYRHLFPKANVGKSCIRFKHLTDIDQHALKQVIQENLKNAPKET